MEVKFCSGEFCDYRLIIPKCAIIEQSEGKLLWLDQRINKLESKIEKLENSSHKHWYK